MKPAPGISIEQQPENALVPCVLVAEAANDGEDGMRAVMSVIINRVRRPHRFGATCKDVVLQPWAFSSLNGNDPNRAHLLDLWSRDPASFALAETIYVQAVAALGDSASQSTVGPSTHYCTNGAHGTLALWGFDDSAHIAAGHPPRWYSQQCIASGVTKECSVVGRQTFGVTA